MEEVVAAIIALFVRLVDGILSVFGLFHAVDRHRAENSRVGESPMEAESRRWWERLFNVWFWISLTLLGITIMVLRYYRE